ncbi:MAG: hypothetical protein K2Y21_05100 [Phycisphaerales bacterium]|nr:hypothetical protein [Phycisphaerales bacterium]
MTTTRRIALAVALLSGAGLTASVYHMSTLVAEHNRQHRKVYYFKEVNVRGGFNFDGRPVRIEDDDPGGPNWHVNLYYGDEVLRLRVAVPGNPKLPNLTPYNDWMRLLMFAESTGLTTLELEAKVKSNEIPARLVVVTRTPMPGSEAGKWGDVWRANWTYDFYEFQRGGGFGREQYRFSTGKPDRAAKSGQLPPDSWQLQAAMSVTPQTQRPNNKFTMDALNAAGWTLPAAAWTSMMLLISAAIVMAPKRRTAVATG